MSAGQHDLALEFPQFKQKIHEKKTEDGHFKRLFEDYERLCKELHRVGEGALAIADADAEIMKKKRLTLKDQLFKILEQD